MEKLAYGLSLLTVLYIIFLYLTVKTLLKDTQKNSSPFKREGKVENRPDDSQYLC